MKKSRTDKQHDQKDPTTLAYSLVQSATALGICLTSLRKEVDKGHLRTIRIGRRRVVTQQALAEYIATKERAAR
jgi:hypothetical protein